MRGRESVFLDANILFSISYGSKGLRRLLDREAAGLCRLLASRYVIEEARRNLIHPGHLAVLQDILGHVRIVSEPDPDISCPIALPHKDKPVFMAAASARADFFLTGDLKHFSAYFGRNVLGVTICTAREYLSRKG